MTAARSTPFTAALDHARQSCDRVHSLLTALAARDGRPHPDERLLPILWQARNQALQALGVALLLEPAPAPGAEEPVTVEPEHAEPPRSPVDVAGLKDHFAQGTPVRLETADPGPSPAEVILAAPMRRSRGSLPEALQEAEQLATELRRLAHHPGLSQSIRTRTVAVLVARARVLQMDWPHPPVSKTVGALFAQLSRFVQDGRCDHVVGLKRAHRPGTGSWRREVDARTGSLRRVLECRVDSAETSKRPSTKPQKSSSTTTRPTPPQHVRGCTDGKSCLVVGADNRSAASKRVADAFGFATVDWERGKKTRSLRSTAKRIKNNRYDVIFILRAFVSHKCTDMLLPHAERKGHAVLAFVDQGYGVGAMERALAKALGDEE